jgi:hypothetical protein
LVASLQECDALVKTQQNRGDFKDPDNNLVQNL